MDEKLLAELGEIRAELVKLNQAVAGVQRKIGRSSGSELKWRLEHLEMLTAYCKDLAADYEWGKEILSDQKTKNNVTQHLAKIQSDMFGKKYHMVLDEDALETIEKQYTLKVKQRESLLAELRVHFPEAVFNVENLEWSLSEREKINL